MPKRIRTRLAPQPSEYGSACLAMLADSFGTHVTLFEAARLCGVTRDGCTMEQLAEGAAALGFRAGIVHADAGSLQKENTPCIVTADGKYALLSGFAAGKAVLYTPDRGRVALEIPVFEESYGGRALFLTPEKKAAAGRARPSALAFAFSLVTKKNLRQTVLYALLLVGTSVLLLWITELAGQITDLVFFGEAGLWQGAEGPGLPAFWKLILVLALLLVLEMWIPPVFARFSAAVSTRCRRSFMWPALNLPIDLYQIRSDGYFMESASHTLGLGFFLSKRMVEVLIRPLFALYYLFFMARSSLPCCLVALCSVTVMATATLVSAGYENRTGRLVSSVESRENGFLLEGLKAIRSIRNSGSEYVFFREFVRLNRETAKAWKPYGRAHKVFQSLPASISNLTKLVLILVGGWGIYKGTLSFGGLVFAHGLYCVIADYIRSAVLSGQMILSTKYRLDNLGELCTEAAAETGKTTSGGETPAPREEYAKLRGHIRLEHVRFGYSRQAGMVLDDISMDIPAGDALSRLRSNAAALKKILSLCGIGEDKLENIENEDILFTPVESDPAWYRHQTGYCLGRDADGNFIALLPGAFSGYYYLDGAGKKRRVTGKNAARFQKVWCLCRLLPEKTLNIQDLLRYLLSFLRRKALAVYILVSLAAGVLGLVFPQMVYALMRAADPSAGGRARLLLGMAVLCVIAELVRLLLNMLLAAFESDFSNAVVFNVKNAALIRYLSNTGAGRGTSEVWTAISDTLREFVQDLLSYGMSLIPHLVFTVCYCLAAAFYLRSLSLWMFLVLALLAVSMWSMEILSDRWCAQSLRNRIRGDHIIFQIFKGIEKIRSRQAQNRTYRKWAEVYAEEAFCDKQRKKYIAASTGIQDFVTPLLTAVLIGAVVFTPITRSDLLTGTLLAGLLAGQIAELTQIAERIVNSKSVWQTISFLFEAPVREKKVKCSDFTAGVRVHRLSFAYPGMERLLDDVSFEVQPGAYIGIVGMSGCGKSTLLKLLLGILTPDKGEISYGRYALSDTDQRSLLRNMGIVLQNESLIPGTIRQNMMMQPRPVTEEKIWQTLETVRIADLVRSWPYGLDTEIGMSGASMSGGQMQKLLIARAIISDPKMIVFDEATSALDNVSQREIKDVLDGMQCTRIVVAHRLSTVRDCDRIILLDQGRISQQGTYEELVNQEGLFRELVLCQGA